MKISYYLPQNIITNEELSELYPEWTVEKILKKTGISSRHISGENELCSDMAVCAAKVLFDEFKIDKEIVDFVLLVTQNPDYMLPTTACIVQNKLGLRNNIGALDINLGCSGFIYGLSVAKSLVQSKTASNVLLLTSEMYSKRIHPMDKSVRTIFGDGAAAALIDEKTASNIGDFVLGTDGRGYDKLIVPASGANENNIENADAEIIDTSNNIRTAKNIFMDGTEIFNFTIDVVPRTVQEVFEKSSLEMDDIDMFVFHQANKFILEYLRKILKIPKNKFYIDILDIGNTVSSSIPIALKRAEEKSAIKNGDKVMLVGFGVGLSWGATIIEY